MSLHRVCRCMVHSGTHGFYSRCRGACLISGKQLRQEALSKGSVRLIGLQQTLRFLRDNTIQDPQKDAFWLVLCNKSFQKAFLGGHGISLMHF